MAAALAAGNCSLPEMAADLGNATLDLCHRLRAGPPAIEADDDDTEMNVQQTDDAVRRDTHQDCLGEETEVHCFIWQRPSGAHLIALTLAMSSCAIWGILWLGMWAVGNQIHNSTSILDYLAEQLATE